MFNLLYKEFKIAIPLNVFLFSFFGIMIIIPNYPVLVGFIYVVMCLVIIFPVANENKDDYFTSILPVKKRDAVKSRFLSVILIQIVSLIITIPFVFVYRAIHSSGSIAPLGLEANLTMFGSVLLIYGIENIAFFPLHYQDGRKLFIPILISLIASFIVMGIIEVLTMIPSLGINDYINGHLSFRLLSFFFGFFVYIVLNFVAYKISAKKFEAVDL